MAIQAHDLPNRNTWRTPLLLAPASFRQRRLVRAGTHHPCSTGNTGEPEVRLAGLGAKLFFDPARTRAGIVTCGPSYHVRSGPANSKDSILCDLFARDAVHAAMAGKTGLVIGFLDDEFIHIPAELLDGHNVLFALDHLRPYFDNGNPGAKARGHLIELVRRLLAGRTKVQARIVFDGPQASVQTLDANLKVEFSGGTADQRADDAIIGHLTQKSFQELKRRTFVVTNDRHLQQRIRTQNAYYMPAGAFDLMLQKFNCL